RATSRRMSRGPMKPVAPMTRIDMKPPSDEPGTLAGSSGDARSWRGLTRLSREAGRLTSARSRGGPFLVGEWMEHIHRIANVETLALPCWSSGSWVHRDTGRFVVNLHRAHRVGWGRRGNR